MRGALPLLVAAMLAPAGFAQNSLTQQRFEQYRAARDERDRTIWAREREALQYERYFIALWDAIRAARDRLQPLRELEFGGLRLGPVTVTRLERDGSWSEPVQLGPAGSYTADEFRDLLDRLAARLVQCEWHHENFRVDVDGTRISTVSMVLHGDRASPEDPARYQVRGRLEVRWSGPAAAAQLPVPTLIEVSALEILEWQGVAPFREAWSVTLEHGSPHDDLLVYDVNGDGLSDLAYPTDNAVFLNEGDMRFRREALCAEAPTVIFESVFADLTGDGLVDFLCAGVSPVRFTPETKMRLFLYEGDGSGHFANPPRRLGPRAMQFLRPDCFAVGDVDLDGDVDVWVTQYLAPYVFGQFPEPYYDANDGHPSWLLLNDGSGNLVDGTAEAGLADRRYRRTFRSSLVDLDEDGDLDLVVVSDFAGVDLYFNDGRGLFTNVTGSVVDDPSSFGMSHTLADFDTDGRIDLYVTGMGSTTARRLAAMSLGRPDMPEHDRMRERIGYGNRMYLATGDGRFRQPGFRDDVARSGWAWGCANLDFDLDGDPDLYVSNGNQSGRSVEDYCTRFWCHDIYSSQRGEDPALARLFADDLRPLRTGRISWNGYEHNHFFVNRGADGFVNAAHLLGLAMEADCRAAVADDFDLDGRPDLLVIAFDRRTSFPRRVVRVMRNEWPAPGHWIGVRLRGAPGVSPLGATVIVETPSGRQAAVVVTGDSAKSQHAHLRHFGLGQTGRVESIEVRWPGGDVSRLERPAIDQYHDVGPDK